MEEKRRNKRTAFEVLLLSFSGSFVLRCLHDKLQREDEKELERSETHLINSSVSYPPSSAMEAILLRNDEITMKER